jgi:hypothetical protein
MTKIYLKSVECQPYQRSPVLVPSGHLVGSIDYIHNLSSRRDVW